MFFLKTFCMLHSTIFKKLFFIMQSKTTNTQMNIIINVQDVTRLVTKIPPTLSTTFNY